MNRDLRGAGKFGYWCGRWCYAHMALRLDGGMRLRKRHEQRAFRSETKRRAYKHHLEVRRASRSQTAEPTAQHGGDK